MTRKGSTDPKITYCRFGLKSVGDFQIIRLNNFIHSVFETPQNKDLITRCWTFIWKEGIKKTGNVWKENLLTFPIHHLTTIDVAKVAIIFLASKQGNYRMFTKREENFGLKCLGLDTVWMQWKKNKYELFNFKFAPRWNHQRTEFRWEGTFLGWRVRSRVKSYLSAFFQLALVPFTPTI